MKFHVTERKISTTRLKPEARKEVMGHSPRRYFCILRTHLMLMKPIFNLTDTKINEQSQDKFSDELRNTNQSTEATTELMGIMFENNFVAKYLGNR